MENFSEEKQKSLQGQGSSIFFIDGGLFRGNKKQPGKIVAYSTIKEFSSERDILNTDMVVNMIQESNLLDNINVTDHAFLKQWMYRKTLTSSFNIEVFTLLQTLYVIQSQELLSKRNKIIIAFDNKGVYNTLIGVVKTPKSVCNLYVKEALRVLKMMNKKYPKLSKRLVLFNASRKDIKLVLGH